MAAVIRPTFDPGFSTPDLADAFSGAARIGHMLEFEASLALVESRHGIVPQDAAVAIARTCRSVQVDPLLIEAEGWNVGTPLVPLLDAVRGALTDSHARWLHHGATTQDAVDTAAMRQSRVGIGYLTASVTSTETRLRRLADEHRSTPVTGRTFLQPARGTTFGWVLEGWRLMLARDRSQLAELRDSLPVQLGGPVGDLQSLGDLAGAVLDDLASELDLAAPPVPWHGDRGPVRAVASALVGVAGTVAKIAEDLILLAQYGEVRMRSGGSSSMPHKRNPIDAIHARAAAAAGIAAAHAITGAPPHELQRSAGSWHTEWWALPMAFQCVGASVQALARAVDTLEVDTGTMSTNLTAAGLTAPDSSSASVLLGRIHEEADET